MAVFDQKIRHHDNTHNDLPVTNLLMMTILITLNKGRTGFIITEKIYKCNVANVYVISTAIISKVFISIVILWLIF